jgi:hypothetical protein
MKRRDFLRTGTALAGVSLIPTIALAGDEQPKLSTDNPQASALQYTETSEKEGQYCHNCSQAKGDLNADWVGCNIFPGKQVKAEGWCSVWSARG